MKQRHKTPSYSRNSKGPKTVFYPLVLLQSIFKSSVLYYCICWINNRQSRNYLLFRKIAILWITYRTDTNSTSFHGSLTQTLIKHCRISRKESCHKWNAKLGRKKNSCLCSMIRALFRSCFTWIFIKSSQMDWLHTNVKPSFCLFVFDKLCKIKRKCAICKWVLRCQCSGQGLLRFSVSYYESNLKVITRKGAMFMRIWCRSW